MSSAVASHPPLSAARWESSLSAQQRRSLAAFETRRDLEASPLWKELGDVARRACETFIHRVPDKPAPRPDRRFLRVVSWNIQRGLYLDALIAVLRSHPVLADLDALMLNEVDLGMARSGNRDVAWEIGQALGLEHVFGNSYLCLSFGDARDGAPQGENAVGLHGNAIFSRWPIVAAQNVSIHVTRDKFQSSEKRLGAKRALWAELDTPLGRIVLANAHLDSVASPQQRATQLADLIASATRAGTPLLLGGDLNTHTYDIRTTGALLKNLWLKLVRGGFPHGVYHYMHPWELYETPVFAALDAADLDWRSFNDLTIGTLRYEVGTFDSESSVREHLPGIAVHILCWKLKPWNGVCPLRVDWLAGRGLRALAEGETVEADSRASGAPRSIVKPLHDGQRISDHDPILADVVPGK